MDYPRSILEVQCPAFVVSLHGTVDCDIKSGLRHNPSERVRVAYCVVVGKIDCVTQDGLSYSQRAEELQLRTEKHKTGLQVFD